MGYKSKQWYEFVNTLPFRNGVFHDKGVVFAKLEDEIENAYLAGYEEAMSEIEDKKSKEFMKWTLAILIFLIILILYTGFLILIFTSK